MCRNAESLYYPVKQSILSALPLVDEFVVAVGKGRAEDQTLELLSSIDSPKLKIIETAWDLDAFPNGTVHAQQTDLAKSHCSGDWLIYLQADEVLHEKEWKTIREGCERHHSNERIEGLLMNYYHFWGDYKHFVNAHGWYQREIRIIRNKSEIHSWQSAQSFRVIEDFDGHSYRMKEGTRKLRVAALDAHVYHYGWVRPPGLMARKVQELDSIHSHQQNSYPKKFNYGDLDKLERFKGRHPEVMQQWIERFDWEEELFKTQDDDMQLVHKHERLSSRVLTMIERNLFGGRQIATFTNYELVE